MGNIRTLDMFSGIGGFRSGLEAIGGFSFVGHCEIDKYANQAYEAIYNTIGNNCGEHTYMGGDRMEEYYPDYGKEAIDFACEIKGYSPEDLDFTLNATGTDYISAEDEEYQVIQVCGITALFSNNRLKMQDVPAGTYLYHLRDSDDGDRFATLEHHVAVNHGGSVVTKEPINFGNKDYIAFTDETSPNFTGEEATFGMFLRDEINLDQGMGGM